MPQLSAPIALWCIGFRAMAAVLLGAASHGAHADAADTVFVPYGEEGVHILQLAVGNETLRGGGSEQGQTLAFGGNPTARWSTAVYAGWYREPGASTEFEGVSWLNHWVLVQRDLWPVDVGAYLEIERPRERDEGYELTWGPTFQFDTTHLTGSANLWLRKSVRVESELQATLIYQAQVKTLVRPNLEWGMQAFGSFGPWRHWDSANRQEHVIGPALFSRWPGAGHTWTLDTALLAGTTSASPRATLRMQGQYRF